MNLLIITQRVDKNDPVLGFFCIWIERFARYFEKVHVIALEVSTYSLPANVYVHSLGKEKSHGRLHRFLFLLPPLLFLKYDSIFVHMNPEYCALFGWFWKLTGKRIALWYTHKSVTWWLRIAEKFADKIFTASRDSFRFPSKKVEIVGHGIDLILFKNYESGIRNYGAGIRLLSVGRIAPSKDLETMVRAVKRLNNEGINVALDIVGAPVMNTDFEYEKAIQELVKNLKLEYIINFLGPKTHNELPEIYRNYDVFIHTSKTGSIDKVVLESFACGTPVISSSEAFREFLPANLKFRENDAIDLAEKIKSFIQTKQDISGLIEKVRNQNNLDPLIRKISNFLNLKSEI